MPQLSGDNSLAILNSVHCHANGFRPRYSRLPGDSTGFDPESKTMRSKPISESLHKRISQTKLCIHHAKGNCVRSHRCSFAHSERELRDPPDLYKTRLCLAWISTQNCSKGKDCIYAHGEHELRWTSEFYKTSLCPSINSKMGCLSGERCRYAHSAQEIRKQLPDGPPVNEMRRQIDDTGKRRTSFFFKKPTLPDTSDVKLEDVTNWRSNTMNSVSSNSDEKSGVTGSGSEEGSGDKEGSGSLVSHFRIHRPTEFTVARKFPSPKDIPVVPYDPYDLIQTTPKQPSNDVLHALINPCRHQEMAFGKELPFPPRTSVEFDPYPNEGMSVYPIFPQMTPQSIPKLPAVAKFPQRSSDSNLCNLSRDTLRSLHEELRDRSCASLKLLDSPPGLSRLSSPCSSYRSVPNGGDVIISGDVLNVSSDGLHSDNYARLASMWTEMTTESDLTSPRYKQGDDELLGPIWDDQNLGYSDHLIHSFDQNYHPDGKCCDARHSGVLHATDLHSKAVFFNKLSDEGINSREDHPLRGRTGCDPALEEFVESILNGD